MINFQLVFIVLSLAVISTSNAQERVVKKVVVTTVTEEFDAEGKIIRKTQVTETKEGPEQTSNTQSPQEAISAPQIAAPVHPQPQPEVFVPVSQELPPVERDRHENLPTLNEDWYFLWGIGFSKENYSGDAGMIYDELKSEPSMSESTFLNMDIFGFYVPSSDHKSIMGVAMNVAGNKLTGPSGHVALYTYLTGFSAMRFFGKNVGDGFFLRGDIGFAHALVELESTTYDYRETSNFKIGTMFGAGYGFPSGYDTRMLIGLYLRVLPSLDIEGLKVEGNVVNLTFGFLF